jgi:flagellar hook-length control protein FliK
MTGGPSIPAWQNAPSINASSTGVPIATALASAAAPPQSQTGVIQTARLIEGAAQSEMHIDLNTRTFGNVEVHTLVRDSQVGLSITSEHGDLRSWLTPEVPALQAVLKRQDLQFENMSFLNSSMANSGGGSGSQARPSPSHLTETIQPTDDQNSEHGLVPESVIATGPYGLNIHA